MVHTVLFNPLKNEHNKKLPILFSVEIRFKMNTVDFAILFDFQFVSLLFFK